MDALVLGLIAACWKQCPFSAPLLSVVRALLLALGKGGMTPLWVVGIQALENNVILPFIHGARHEVASRGGYWTT